MTSNRTALQHYLWDRSLTARQIQVVESLLKGHSNKEIALDLNITVKMVKTHLTEVYLRMRVANRAQLMAQCLPILDYEMEGPA